jgi:hypothetical protein
MNKKWLRETLAKRGMRPLVFIEFVFNFMEVIHVQLWINDQGILGEQKKKINYV